MRTILAAALLCVATLAVLIFGTRFALAGDSSVVLPWGDWVNQVLGEVTAAAMTVAVLLVTWALKFLPATLKAYVDKQRIEQAEQLLAQAIAYGANAVGGAVKGQVLDVELGSKVAAQALQYAVDNGPGWLIAWLGGADQVLQKLIARLELTPETTAEAVATNVKIVPGAAP